MENTTEYEARQKPHRITRPVCLPESLDSEVRRLAQAENRSVSNLLATAALRYIQASRREEEDRAWVASFGGLADPAPTSARKQEQPVKRAYRKRTPKPIVDSLDEMAEDELSEDGYDDF